MPGHTHLGGAHMTQNQGNVLGDRPCVRQSKIGREHEGGNQMKDLLGHNQLAWNTNKTEGAYQGGNVYNHDNPQGGRRHAPQQHQPSPVQQFQQEPLVQKPTNQPVAQVAPKPQQQADDNAYRGRRGAGAANRTTYNFMTGE